MKTPLSRHSLKYRIAIIIFLLELIMMAAVLGVTLSHSFETSQKHLEKSETVLMELLADLSRISLITAEYDELQPYFEQITGVPHVSTVFLANRDNRIVASSDVKYIGKTLVKPTRSESTIWKETTISNATGKIGTLAINFSHQDLIRANQASWNLGIKIALTGMIVIALVGIAIGYLLTRRLESLAQSAQRIARGDMDVRTRLRGDDEVAIVGQAFDEMAENLKTYIDNLVDREEQLRRAHDELEKRVRDRTRQLAEAKDEAVRANRSKSTFLANISHEIRTPLTAIIGFSEALLDKSQSDRERTESTHTIIDSGKHLLRIINDILDLSKIEAEKLEIENLEVSPFALLNDVKSIVTLQAENKGLYFKLSYDFPLPARITSDAVRIRQILLNLCGNAIKFTSTGGITLKVSCDCQAQQIVFKVIDTGIGLNEAQQQRIFNAFEQADSTTTRKFGGTGLGLSLSKSLAKLLGGSITVSSTPDVGSCFTLTVATGILNTCDLLSRLPDEEQPQDDIEQSISTSLLGEVLLVEDNRDNQKLISMYLRRTGVNVTLAKHGQEALDLARDRKFDLILMDIQMPVMGGLEATRLLRTIGYDKPIAALTANAMKEEEERCQQAGCDAFLAKPIDLAEFYNLLNRYLRPVNQNISNISQQAVISALAYEGDGVFDELIREFVDGLPETLREIRSSFDRSHWDEFRDQVHTLKGTGGNFGFDEITRICREIEIETDGQHYQKVRALLGDLDILYERILMGLKVA